MMTGDVNDSRNSESPPVTNPIMTTEEYTPSEFDLLSYEQEVGRLAAERPTMRGAEGLYFNSGQYHAKIVIEKLLNVAKDKISIFSAGLNKKVFSQDIFDVVLKTVKAENIRIVLSDPEGEETNQDLVGYLQEKGVEIKTFREIGNHLITVDGDCFRFETDLEKMIAFYGFGDKDYTENLDSSFNKIWAVADYISPKTSNPSEA